MIETKTDDTAIQQHDNYTNRTSKQQTNKKTNRQIMQQANMCIVLIQGNEKRLMKFMECH